MANVSGVGEAASSSGVERAEWRRLIALGALTGDLTASGLAQLGRVPLTDAEAALAAAVSAGHLLDGVLDAGSADRVLGWALDGLDPGDVSELFDAAARRLLMDGPARLVELLSHARSIRTNIPFTGLVEIADRSAETSLSTSDYDAARRLLELAIDLAVDDTPVALARRWINLSVALEGLGEVHSARRAAARGFDFAELANDIRLTTDAAITYALPVDWYAGDTTAGALLQRAERLAITDGQRVALSAARAVVEMRIPISVHDGQQFAWATRASVAQPLAEWALSRSDDCSERDRALALLAWRTTHRAPQHLIRRRDVAAEAVDLTQRLRLPARQVEAAVMLAVDSLESADRPQFDRAVSIARWVAERDGNPRLQALAFALSAGAAHLDGDLGRAIELRERAYANGSIADASSTMGADLVLMAQEVMARNDLDEVRSILLPADHPAMMQPIARFTVALGHARLGEHAIAEQYLRWGLARLDEESSLLLCAVLATQVAILLDVSDAHRQLVELLDPWADRVAVDSNGWWCGGPVSLALAELHHVLGDIDAASRRLSQAERMRRDIADGRSRDRVESLRERLDAVGAVSDGRPTPGIGSADGDEALTDRETAVLRLLADGATNVQIAEKLFFSEATVKRDTMAIYRKLGVKGRAHATAVARERRMI